MFTPANLALGILAAIIVGLSKTAVPGGGLLATPVLAAVVAGRLIAGTIIPVLLVGDVLAVYLVRRSVRRDVLRPLVLPVAAGFGLGTLFYVLVGAGGRVLDVMIGATIVSMVLLQMRRLIRRSPPVPPTRALAGGVGLVGGFTTFVSNAAGPVINTYFTGIGLPKNDLISTSAWFYLAVNSAKVPAYFAIGQWSSGGPFFTAETLRFDLAIAPGVFIGVAAGRWLLPRLSQQVFTHIVLVLAGGASVKLLLGW